MVAWMVPLTAEKKVDMRVAWKAAHLVAKMVVDLVDWLVGSWAV